MTTLVQWLNRRMHEMERGRSRYVSFEWTGEDRVLIKSEAPDDQRVAGFGELMAALGQLEFQTVVESGKIWRRDEAIKAVKRGELNQNWVPNWDPEEEVEDES